MWDIDNIRLTGPGEQQVGRAVQVDIAYDFSYTDTLGSTERTYTRLDDKVKMTVEFILTHEEWNSISKVKQQEEMLPAFTSLKRKTLPK
jgi:hypothetical protein